jgi:hypothetical protein
LQEAVFHRLEQMEIDPSFLGTTSVFIGTTASERDAEGPSPNRLLPQSPRDLPSIQARQANFQENYIRWISLGQPQNGQAIPGDTDTMSVHFEKQRHALRVVGIRLREENIEPRARAGLGFTCAGVIRVEVPLDCRVS